MDHEEATPLGVILFAVTIALGVSLAAGIVFVFRSGWGKWGPKTQSTVA